MASSRELLRCHSYLRAFVPAMPSASNPSPTLPSSCRSPHQVSSGSPDLPAAPETQSPLSPDTGIICLPCRLAPRGQCCVLASLSDRGREARALGLDSRWGAEKQDCPSCRPELATGTLSQDATPCPSPALSAFIAVVVPVPPTHLSLSPQGQEEGGIVSPTGISSWPASLAWMTTPVKRPQVMKQHEEQSLGRGGSASS